MLCGQEVMKLGFKILDLTAITTKMEKRKKEVLTTLKAE